MKSSAEILRDNERWKENRGITWLEYAQMQYEPVYPDDTLDVVDREIATLQAEADRLTGRIA